MTAQLLPSNFDDLVQTAVDVFWRTRAAGSSTQGGTRGNVIGGKNLDGFLAVLTAISTHCGLPKSSVFTNGRTRLTLPGYYRPVKSWDVVIVHRRRLLCVLEFKSQVGSFGNNFNNRSEEAIGNASDLWMAAQKGAFHPARHTLHAGESDLSDPRPPFLGYLMVLEDCEDSNRPIGASSPHYHIFPEFEGASYAERYQLLCEKLMEQGLYDAASLLLSEKPTGGVPARSRSLSPATDVRNLFTQIAGHLLAAVQSSS